MIITIDFVFQHTRNVFGFLYYITMCICQHSKGYTYIVPVLSAVVIGPFFNLLPQNEPRIRYVYNVSNW